MGWCQTCLIGLLCCSVQRLAAAAPPSTSVRGDRSEEGPRSTLEGEALRALPGSLGDPFRALSFFPGVLTPIPALPLFALRGAAPGTTGFYLDGMRLPQIFHVFFGNAVIHPALVAGLDLYPGAYDASIGHQSGGVIRAYTRPARKSGFHGEAELRLHDVSAALELGLPRGVRVSASGHYTFQGPLLRAFLPQIDVSFWDYQLRLDVGPFTMLALGSSDSINIDSELTGSIGALNAAKSQLSFHRVQLRLAGTLNARLRAEAALHGAVDQSGELGGASVRKLALGGRATLFATLGPLVLQAGLDAELSRFTPQGVTSSPQDMLQGGALIPVNRDDLGDLGTERAGFVGGAYLQGALRIGRRVSLHAGLRLDTYHAAGVTALGLDPRARLRARLTPWLTLSAGGGVYQQPPTFPLSLPGIDTFALQLGLQRAVHASVDQEIALPLGLSLRATGFYQRYTNATDYLDLSRLIACWSPPLPQLSGSGTLSVRVADGASYGAEVLLRRSEGRISGLIAYTLSRSERSYACGLTPTDYDQTHTLSIVAQLRLPFAILVGVRVLVQSGLPVTRLRPDHPERSLRNTERLPPYGQLDVRLDRAWHLRRRFVLAAFLELINATYSAMNLSITYPKVGDPPRPDLTNPMPWQLAWILPSAGLRLSF